MTPRRTPTDRQRDTRARKRANGLIRRSVWFDKAALSCLADIKRLTGMTQDAAIAFALSHGLVQARHNPRS